MKYYIINTAKINVFFFFNSTVFIFYFNSKFTIFKIDILWYRINIDKLKIPTDLLLIRRIIK